eukprot:TRINITY_DN2034_c2_g1_i1.p1 TRINITY_DN2034_c2_g1~~TRINITY_DN2034_c2_g1_i1.p1  ORF type:complete len:1142 (+),score=272.42 TRINITY_DN2034_c2_g1_i1:43-3426(+)
MTKGNSPDEHSDGESSCSSAIEVVVAGRFKIKPNAFLNMITDKDISAYKQLGMGEGIMQSLDTSMESGIKSSTIAERKKIYGINKLPEEEEVTYWRFLKEALSDKMMILLLVLGITALIIGLTTPEAGKDEVHYSTAWIDGTFIIVAVSIVVLVTTINDYLKELKFKALNDLTSKVAVTVLRDGDKKVIDISELVVGDIVEFAGGLFIPADGIFLTGQGFSIDEAACTGENDEKKKNTVPDPDTGKLDPFIISGTSVIAGEEGRYLIIGVGEKSFSGNLEMQTRSGKQPTPLQEKLDDLADTVGWVGIGVAILLFVTLALISIIKAAVNGDNYDFKLLLDYSIVGVSIIVVAVPEGLPLSVVIALAYSMQAMMKDNNMVRSLVACETMGAATNICSDKTGTLTTNEMTQIRAFIGLLQMKRYDHNASTSLWLKDLNDNLANQTLQIYCDAVAFNSTAKLVKNSSKKKDAPKMIWLGNKTEQGMLRWVNRVDERKVHKIRESCEDKYIYPFQSKKKSMTTLVKQDHSVYGKKIMQYSKGGTEVILKRSTRYINGSGEICDLTDEVREKINDTVEEYGNEALRTLGVGFRIYSDDINDDFPTDDPLDGDLIFLGVVGIEDPVRTEVPAAVARCQRAGVTVRMCTGDNIVTAKAIAMKCGIYSDKVVAMEGPAFRQLFVDDEKKFMKILPSIQVLARCSPLDKQLLVGNLMMLGEVVAVTGDGTNDAPALKLADVGFAMNDGTDVAKKASKIILLDNNFVSVVQACKWGRNVNDNIRKFVQFQFTANCVLLVVTFVGAIKDAARSDGTGEPPLAPVHLLWANLIMDTMAALALSTENPDDEALLSRPPTYRDSPLISYKMRRFVLGNAIFMILVLHLLIFSGEELFETKHDYTGLDRSPEALDDHDEDNLTRLRTVVFNTYIYMQVINWFHARKLYDEKNPFEGFGRSKFFLPIVLFTAAFQAFMVEVAQGFMETISIGSIRWAATIGIALLMFPYGVMLRFYPIHEPRHKCKRLDEEEEGEDEKDAEVRNSKLKLIKEVNAMQREIVKGALKKPAEKQKKKKEASDVTTDAARELMQQRIKEALQRVQQRVRVVRAIRGRRGDPLNVKRSSGVNSTFSRASSRGFSEGI